MGEFKHYISEFHRILVFDGLKRRHQFVVVAHRSDSLSSSTSSTLTIATNYVGASGYAGITTLSSNIFNFLLSANIKANTYYLSNYSADKKQFVMAHEVGHALGLDHAGASTIMANGTSYYDIYLNSTPTADDRAGINVMY